ncbi:MULTISPECIES: septation ring formation regulator EzrA [unclassified Streptococcus]|uniref:septation ring formation regulator EzrA n=1 Tax=unclassified Streptococcus TaxID=2608887 RepID=UPI0010729B01|nr:MULTISPECIES: septation ring formation regulator EzrA [unclassified Streptococcus]MBF0805918.1 septation ring formation regulator EzrA [Streptococcus sp. 19428wA2_WM07]TFU28536.1 septation ring formation regulator EzrA [Streptococcus sp. WM07]
MSSGLIILVIVIVVLLIVAYIVAILLRKRNDTLLTQLEERKTELFNLPVNEDMDRVKSMHLIGQSQINFREWHQKWMDISLNSFAAIETDLFEAEAYNNSFRFIKTKQTIGSVESQLNLVSEDVQAIRQAVLELEQQEAENSGRVLHALDLFEKLQENVEKNEVQYGQALPEIRTQMEHIEAEFSRFVKLNSSGDPVEAAEVLDKTENYIIALSQIVEGVPEVVEQLESKLPDQLDDLETGYRKLLEEDYHFQETDIEARFQQLHSRLQKNGANLKALELDSTKLENELIQEDIDGLYAIFTKEMDAKKEVDKLIQSLPNYLRHTQSNNQNLVDEAERLSVNYIVKESGIRQIHELQSELIAMEKLVMSRVDESQHAEEIPFSQVLEELEDSRARLEKIEDVQMELGDSLAQIEKDDSAARQKVSIAVNKLHTIKRYMEKRKLPGIPQSFLSLFFTASHNAEDLLNELDQERVDVESVNRLLEILNQDMAELEAETYTIVGNATLTEQLLQYSNRYRSFDETVQAAFQESLHIFEEEFDYQASFQRISDALETVEPGVTERFVKSYEKTREKILF